MAVTKPLASPEPRERLGHANLCGIDIFKFLNQIKPSASLTSETVVPVELVEQKEIAGTSHSASLFEIRSTELYLDGEIGKLPVSHKPGYSLAQYPSETKEIPTSCLASRTSYRKAQLRAALGQLKSQEIQYALSQAWNIMIGH